MTEIIIKGVPWYRFKLKRNLTELISNTIERMQQHHDTEECTYWLIEVYRHRASVSMGYVLHRHDGDVELGYAYQEVIEDNYDYIVRSVLERAGLTNHSNGNYYLSKQMSKSDKLREWYPNLRNKKQKVVK